MDNRHLKIGDRIYYISGEINSGEPYETPEDDMGQIHIVYDVIEDVEYWPHKPDGPRMFWCREWGDVQGDYPIFPTYDDAISHLDSMVLRIKREGDVGTEYERREKIQDKLDDFTRGLKQ